MRSFNGLVVLAVAGLLSLAFLGAGQSLCVPCHNAKTNRVDGGFGRPRQPQRR